jgi:hypothetical protein
MIFSGSYLWVYLFGSLVLGAVIGAFDYQANQMTLVTIFLFVPNSILGFLRPRLAWLNAMSCSLGFLIIEIIVGSGLNIPPVRWPYFNLFAALITPIPAFIGSYWGAAMRWIYNAAKRLNEK